MKKLMFIVVLFLASASLFSQEYEIAWEKDINGSFAQFSKNGEYIYVANGSLIQKYRSSDGSFVSTFDYNGLPSLYCTHNFYVSNNGNYLISGSAIDKTNGFLYFWDLKTEKAIKRLNIGYSDFIDDYRMIITDYIHPAPTLKIFDFINEKVLLSKSFFDNFNLVKLSHNGKMFATASKNGSKNYLTLWNTDSLTEIKRFELNGDAGTTFIDIKFSWDDKFVGVNTLSPYDAYFFDIENKNLYLNSKNISPLGIARFSMTSDNNYFVFNYNNFSQNYYNFYIVDRTTLKTKQIINIYTNVVETSSNNLIFAGTALFRPKSTDVTGDTNTQIFKISSTSNNIIINNSSELINNVKLELIDLKGNIVFFNIMDLLNGNNAIQIPKTIANGTYILNIKYSDKSFSQKILIQR